MNVTEQLAQARKASKSLLSLTDRQINDTLNAVADALEAATDAILQANAQDLEKMDSADPKYDRLRLTPQRISAIAADTRTVATLPSPRRTLDSRVRPNGLRIKRVAVPFGVIGVIYEARPNVTVDVFSLCLKSCNVCVLKGGHDAACSNQVIVGVIRGCLRSQGIDEDAVTLLAPTREATTELLRSRGMVDLIIPRGSAGLICSVREQATVPVIETGAGVCHCYIDDQANVEMAAKIVDNAKTRRVSVCNALDCMLIHESKLSDICAICAHLSQSDVVIHADEPSYQKLSECYPTHLLRHACEADYGTEYLAYAMAVRTVSSLDEALAHIDRYGSGHSEAIVTDDREHASRFQRDVDAACVYVNAPTSFTDGAQFGLGAEIGISTQKLHARGPMGLEELMTYKWLIDGQGQTRPQ